MERQTILVNRKTIQLRCVFSSNFLKIFLNLIKILAECFVDIDKLILHIDIKAKEL